MFNEIWQIRDFEHLAIPDFELANFKQRENNRGGGCIIYIRNNLEYEKFDSPTINGLMETIAILIKNTVVTSLYRPPAGNTNAFVDELTNWIERLGNKKIYIAGDFNLNLKADDIYYYNSIETATSLSPKIRDVTRVISQTCIDNILTNMEGIHSVSQICIADHQGLTSKITAQIKKRDKTKFVYRQMRESNWSVFSTEVSKLSIRGTTINEKWNYLGSDIKQAVEKSFPEKHSNIKYTFEMSRGLLKSKNKKNKLLRQYKRGMIAKEVYTRYNKIYRKLILHEQETSFKKKNG